MKTMWNNFIDYFSTEGAINLSTSLIKIIIILILAKLFLTLGRKFVTSIFTAKLNSKFYFEERRAATLSTLLNNILLYVVYFISIIAILTEIGIPVAPILAGAGVVSLAVGFGAQNLVRDVITGFFIIFEDQYAVGEYVTIGAFTGIVEEIGIRVTKLRDPNGQLHIIPNGSIVQVTNFNRGSLRALVEVGIAYESDVEKAINILNQVGLEVTRDFPEIVEEEPKALGVVNFGPSEIIIRMVGKTKPLEQWNIERELRKRIKAAFDREGIEIPYPKRVFVNVGDK